MENATAEISVKGKSLKVPSIEVDGRTVVITGNRVKVARVRGEDWLPDEAVKDPARFVEALRKAEVVPDWFTFVQKFTQPVPRHPFPYAWDDVAAIPITTFEEWWEKRVSHDLRKDVKRAEKRGVAVREVELTDSFVLGIKGIYDESPIRQGKRFWHYGKDPVQIKEENSSYLDRSRFFGAFLDEELIGFIKIVRVGEFARLMQILCKDEHQDKRPGNALIVKAVQECSNWGVSYLTYGNYTYGNRKNSPLTFFKRRNGFEEIIFPRYFVPITAKGALMIRMGLHLDPRRFLPGGLLNYIISLRDKVVEGRTKRNPPKESREEPGESELKMDCKAAR